MYKKRKIAVVVPCYNEESQLAKVVNSMPVEVDLIVVIDDCSTDNTVSVAKHLIETSGRAMSLIEHETNQGVGAAIASGYKLAAQMDFDLAVVMAGDAQMDSTDFFKIVDPIVVEGYDYAKGNRLYTGDAWNKIPRLRYVGNSILSLLTKIASGYWHVADSQSGYTAISKKALNTINWDEMYKRYGQPNDLLVRLNVYRFRVKDVSIAPTYNVGEVSKMKPMKVMPKIAWLILRLFFYRMKHLYFIRDFHPLLFFYMFGFFLFLPGFFLGVYLFLSRMLGGEVAETSAIFSVFLTVMGVQFLLFAMWFDMENNRDLK